MRIPKDGGTAVDITAIPGGGFFGGAAWLPDDRIVFGFGACSHLHVVRSSGGTASPLANVGDDSTCHLRPEILPDGNTLLWRSSLGIQALDLANGRRTSVVAGNAPRYAGGYLILSRGPNLLAAPMDMSRAQLTGTVAPFIEGIAVETSAGTVQYSLSANGTLAYVPDSGIYELVLIEPNGAQRLITEQRRFFQNPQFSPDGRRVAVAANRLGEGPDIWIYDVNGGNPFRLTFDGGRAPVWTPDGLAVTFSHLGQEQGIYNKRADGATDAQLLLSVPEFHWLMGWTPDGKTLGFGRILSRAEDGTSSGSFEVLAEGESHRILGPAQLWAGRLSPDGRWLAYYSLESGRFENYVTPFPKADTKWLITEGTNPRWSPDGKEIYYRNGNRLEAVRIDIGSGIRVLSKRKVVEPFTPPLYDDYDVHPDGQTVVIVRPSGNSDGREIVVVLNALTALKQSSAE